MKTNNAYKKSLFENANAYLTEAIDLSEAGRLDDSRYYRMCFDEAFKKIRIMGWDKEFMGIA